MELKRLILILLCAVMLFSTGCYDSVELNEIFIVTGLGFDASSGENMSDYTFQVGRVQKQSKSSPDGEGSTLLLTATNESFLSAIDDFLEENSRKLFLSHNQAIVFGREQAKEGIRKFFDSFLREREIRPETWLVVADQKASDVLKAKTEPEKISGVTIGEVMQNRNNSSENLTMSILEFTLLSQDETSAPMIPVCKVEEQDEQTNLSFHTMAVFKNYSMIGELTLEEVQGYLWATGGINGAEFELKMQDGMVVLDPYTFKWATEPMLNPDGSVQVKISISVNMLIREIQGFSDKTLKEMLPQMEQSAQDYVSDLIKGSFEKACELKADVFGFGAAFNRKYPQQWQEMKQHWDEIFPKLELQTDIQIIVRDMGAIAKNGQMKEG